MIPGTHGKSIGRAIRHARQRQRLTQQQLADEIGVDRSAVSAWERGLHFPQRFEGLLEEVLGIRLDDIEPGDSVVEIDRRTRRLLRNALQNDDDYERVIALLEGRLAVTERAAEGPA